MDSVKKKINNTAARRGSKRLHRPDQAHYLIFPMILKIPAPN